MNLFDEVRNQIIACMGQDRILAGENWGDEINKLTNVELLELISTFLENGK